MTTNKRTKLAIVSEPASGGVKRHVVELLLNLDLIRFEVFFIYSLSRNDATYKEEIAEIKNRGIETCHVLMHRKIGFFYEIRNFLEILHALKRFQPQVIHFHSSKAGFLGRFAAFVGSRNAATVYTPNALASYFSFFFNHLERTTANITDIMIAVSNSEMEDFLRWKVIRREKIRMIPLAVKSEYPQRTRANGPPYIIGACGRTCFQKNTYLFFQIAAMVMRSRTDIEFVWIGDEGTDREAKQVQQLIKTDPYAAKVKITGWVADADQHIANLDILCMFSRYESFGYVTLDALVMGTVVVGTPVSGTVDLIDNGLTGIICEPDMERLSALIIDLIDNASLRQELAANAKRIVSEKFSLEKMLVSLHSLYEEVAEKAAEGKLRVRN